MMVSFLPHSHLIEMCRRRKKGQTKQNDQTAPSSSIPPIPSLVPSPYLPTYSHAPIQPASQTSSQPASSYSLLPAVLVRSMDPSMDPIHPSIIKSDQIPLGEEEGERERGRAGEKEREREREGGTARRKREGITEWK